MTHSNFYLYKSFFGLIGNDSCGSFVYGYENILKTDWQDKIINIPNNGGCFIVVQRGSIEVNIFNQKITISNGQWLSTKNGFDFILKKNTIVAVFQKENYLGIDAMGIIEDDGRLKYIDGCKDTMIFQPIILGLPCLNALFIPNGVHQTMHTHPSTRAGIILDGVAFCNTPKKEYKLQPGMIFFLPKNGNHKFRTDFQNGNLKLAAYHPDSDIGPTDDNHAMINRTLVDNISASKINSIKTK